MSQAYISVIIPSYNSENYIFETIKSLSDQNSTDFEAIIIDDGSNDKTIEVASAALKQYNISGQVMVRDDSVPKGVANCRNLGIKKAKGDWISFLDSDDLMLPGKISGTIDLINKYGDSCQAYHHAARQFEDVTNKTLSIPARSTDAEPVDILAELCHKNIITTSSVTIKKTTIDEIGGFDSTLHGIEDYMLWLKVAKRTKWYYSSKVWTDYRVRTSSLMGGRRMTYYIEQNTKLIASVKASNEFTQNEISSIEYYLFDGIMNYYAIVSLNVYGWKDFFSGLKKLILLHKRPLAIRLFKKHFKFLVLNKLSFFKKSLSRK